MFLRRRSVITLLVAACMNMAALAEATPGGEGVSMGTAVGQMHPDFLLPKIDGGWARLSDFRGKKTLLIHFASW